MALIEVLTGLALQKLTQILEKINPIMHFRTLLLVGIMSIPYGIYFYQIPVSFYLLLLLVGILFSDDSIRDRKTFWVILIAAILYLITLAQGFGAIESAKHVSRIFAPLILMKLITTHNWEINAKRQIVDLCCFISIVLYCIDLLSSAAHCSSGFELSFTFIYCVKLSFSMMPDSNYWAIILLIIALVFMNGKTPVCLQVLINILILSTLSKSIIATQFFLLFYRFTSNFVQLNRFLVFAGAIAVTLFNVYFESTRSDILVSAIQFIAAQDILLFLLGSGPNSFESFHFHNAHVLVPVILEYGLLFTALAFFSFPMRIWDWPDSFVPFCAILIVSFNGLFIPYLILNGMLLLWLDGTSRREES